MASESIHQTLLSKVFVTDEVDCSPWTQAYEYSLIQNFIDFKKNTIHKPKEVFPGFEPKKNKRLIIRKSSRSVFEPVNLSSSFISPLLCKKQKFIFEEPKVLDLERDGKVLSILGMSHTVCRPYMKGLNFGSKSKSSQHVWIPLRHIHDGNYFVNNLLYRVPGKPVNLQLCSDAQGYRDDIFRTWTGMCEIRDIFLLDINEESKIEELLYNFGYNGKQISELMTFYYLPWKDGTVPGKPIKKVNGINDFDALIHEIGKDNCNNFIRFRKTKKEYWLEQKWFICAENSVILMTCEDEYLPKNEERTNYNWEEREEIKRADDYTCWVCGKYTKQSGKYTTKYNEMYSKTLACLNERGEHFTDECVRDIVDEIMTQFIVDFIEVDHLERGAMYGKRTGNCICGPCNGSKSNLDAVQFMLKRAKEAASAV